MKSQYRVRRLPLVRAVAAVLVALAAAGPVLPAQAVDVSAHAFATTSPVDYYRNATQLELVSCGERVQSTFKRLHALDRSDGGCIAVGRRACRTNFEAALQAVRKPDAREALRAYHHAFVTALDGVAPQQGEASDGYQRRQQELQHLLAHAWTRFELAE